ncbi:Kiwa anti-phage protein KwaB-like domain-containing protein [Latilactobacillus curvatus]|uniref:Kiwa anti-phage protein KwaB-like domain-containing protein n=1 Tax=Latilactobacillus curvatus TaxID=28038 RepID=UPI001648E558|nr:Kiwa anti-phage protein KwaB-like domain-containing protein [Latilactobacillus curvatus]
MDLMDLKNVISTGSKPILHMAHRGSKIAVVTPSIGDKLAQQIRDIFIKELENNGDVIQEKYNVVGCNDGVIELADRKEYGTEIKIITEAIKTPTKKFRFKPDNFDFFIYEFPNNSSDKDPVYAFRRTRKMKFLKKGIIGKFTEGYFSDLELTDLIGVDDYVDFIIYKDEILILQHISFERILKLNNQFTELAKEVLSNKKFSKKIVGFDKLKEGALSNANYVKRLSKLGSDNNPTLFLEDLTATKNVSEEFNLEIRIDVEKDQIFYEDDSQLGNFINLMQDAYYHTLIGNKSGVDDRR